MWHLTAADHSCHDAGGDEQQSGFDR